MRLAQRFALFGVIEGLLLCHLASLLRIAGCGARNLHHIDDLLAQPLRHDTVRRIKCLLFLASASVSSIAARIESVIRSAYRIARPLSAPFSAYGLICASVGNVQEPLIGIENGHQGDFWHIQSFTQQVDTHQHVKLYRANRG